MHVLGGLTSIDIFKEMYDELFSDLRRAKSDAHLLGEQFHRRMYLRTLMTYSEAMLFRLKQHLSDQRNHLKIELNQNEQLLLDEQTVEMTENGKLQRKGLTASHVKNIKFTFNFIARKLELSELPDFGGKGWKEYNRAIEKRNELTHPKFPKDLQITNDELQFIDAAELWLDQELAKVMSGWASKSKLAHVIAK